MYKYETHMHTREASACAWSTGAEMAEKYKAEGYTGIIVTDHFFNGNSAIPRDLPWKERIELYCKGYENAKARGDEIGLDVFFGFEYGDGGSDFLVYGLDKQWLIKNDHILDIGLTDFLEYARSCGGFVVHAHPFREYEYIRSTVHAPRFVDAVEGVNASHCKAGHCEFNDRAKLFAEWYGLPVTGGSDAHNTVDKWYGGGVLSETKFSSVMDYARAVAERKVICIDPCKNK
ncbi:MAG: PHP domain-containing protein [Oscillospiraceae bacterium]|nr:PHP domain-containing protein [Oscillospiraceae bacterium]